MSGQPAIEVVCFDLMDTLVHDPFREALEAATGRSLQEVFAARSPGAYPRFEAGQITEREYWAHYERAGLTVDVEAFHRTRRSGYRWLPGVPELLDDLAGVVRLIGATNYPDWVRELESGILAGRLEAVHASYELGARKPDRDFYVRLLRQVRVRPEVTLFVDDREENVVGARAAGLRAHRFTDAATLRAELSGLLAGAPGG